MNRKMTLGQLEDKLRKGTPRQTLEAAMLIMELGARPEVTAALQLRIQFLQAVLAEKEARPTTKPARTQKVRKEKPT